MSLNWDLPYTSRRSPVLAQNLVATSQPLAAQAGLKMMQLGGNAVDAAVAAAIALTVVEPVSAGIGGDAFALLWDGVGVQALNGSGRTPQAFDASASRSYESSGELFGWDSVTVPGTVSAWVALSQRFGRLPFEKLFEPAVAYARDGFLVTPTVARQWSGLNRLYEHFPETGPFFPDGKSPDAGALFSYPDQAKTLEEIGASKGASFYCGSLARKIADHAKAAGAALSLGDLEQHKADWVQPLSIQYRDLTVHEMPPNSQGLVASIALGILQHFDMSQFAVNSAESIHLQIEALRLAFSDVDAHLGDPSFMSRSPHEFLDPKYLLERANQINFAQAQFPISGLSTGSGGTTYIAAADKSGMMISLIQSNGRGFGSGIIVPQTGIALHNRARAFSRSHGHANQIAANKRPYHTNAPALVTRNGRPLLAFGLMGWTMQPQAHVQFLTRLADYNENPQAVLDAPRWRLAVEEPSIVIEQGISAQVQADLTNRGHDILAVERKYLPASTPFGSYMMFGAAQMLLSQDHGYVGASDPRRDGQVVGF